MESTPPPLFDHRPPRRAVAGSAAGGAAHVLRTGQKEVVGSSAPQMVPSEREESSLEKNKQSLQDSSF